MAWAGFLLGRFGLRIQDEALASIVCFSGRSEARFSSDRKRRSEQLIASGNNIERQPLPGRNDRSESGTEFLASAPKKLPRSADGSRRVAPTPPTLRAGSPVRYYHVVPRDNVSNQSTVLVRQDRRRNDMPMRGICSNETSTHKHWATVRSTAGNWPHLLRYNRWRSRYLTDDSCRDEILWDLIRFAV